MEKATFAVSSAEAAFPSVAGVRGTRAGSIVESAYEAIELDYDPWKVSYDDLLEIFWAAHGSDPPGLGDLSAYGREDSGALLRLDDSPGERGAS